MFPGFPPEALTFLRNLKKNNNRDWFQPRKETFETKLKTPMMELVEGINAELLKFAPHHITDARKAIYRIYRDTRFSADKTPYKTHIAAVFPKHGADRHSSAGFYFHVAATDLAIAAGAYMPGPEDLYAIRTWITENHKEFLRIAKGVEKVFGELRGESLSRSPKGFDPAHPAAALVRRKAWYYAAELDLKLATTAKLQPEIVRHFKAVAPFIEAMNGAIKKRGAASHTAL
jgi:uncharacterized protein (TIGR02453 family)